MLKFAQSSKYSGAIAAEKQTLSMEEPGTIGFEIEQLYYHGECFGPTIEIELKAPNQEPKRYLPHEFLMVEKPSSTNNYVRDGAYNALLMQSDIFGIKLDTTFIKKNHTAPSYEIAHVLEFVTPPLKINQALNAALVFVGNTVKDLYQYCERKHDTGSANLDDWKGVYNIKTYATNHQLETCNDFTPASTDSGKSTHPLIILDTTVIKPLFAIHVNTSILLEQMYTLEMREAFPIFNQYPPLVPGASTLSLKDWPSCRPNPAYELWELTFTKQLNESVKRFTETHLNSLSPYSQARVSGLFRTLIYCYTIMTYYNSGLRTQHYPDEVYESGYEKDFFLHGIPKIHFDYLARQGLTDNEKLILALFLNEKSNLAIVELLFENLLKKSGLTMGESISCPNNYTVDKMNITQFVYNCLVAPIIYGHTTKTRLHIRTVEKTLPQLPIDKEFVCVPVLEFRAPKGNGCTLAELELLLTTQAKHATSFAQKGFDPKAKNEAENESGRQNYSCSV
jgi:hypothetical protein